MRERAFAVLGDRVSGARVLDLFAGTGAVGLEALSRGAREVVFVERERRVAALIRASCADLGVDAEVARVMVCTARSGIRRLARGGGPFDLVWADPPFECWEEGLAALVEVQATGLLAPGGTACLECPQRATVDPNAGLEIVRELAGGASRVVLIEPRES
jgi:16S rRNA (guanine(966)-N(2))-methyltransferase RsmD